MGLAHGDLGDLKLIKVIVRWGPEMFSFDSLFIVLIIARDHSYFYEMRFAECEGESCSRLNMRIHFFL